MEFRFLSRFWGKERKEVEFSILRSAIASTSHLKSELHDFGKMTGNEMNENPEN